MTSNPGEPRQVTRMEFRGPGHVFFCDPPGSGSALPRGGADLPPEWPAHGAIAIQHLSAVYRPGLPLVLKSVSVRFAAGGEAAVARGVGPMAQFGFVMSAFWVPSFSG